MIKNYTLFCESLKSDMWSIIPQSVKELHKIFNKAGKKLYVVGGAVRDFLNEEKPKDFDLATDALPDEVIKILQSYNYDFNLQGKAFGVVVVFTDDEPSGMEIATFREDVSKGRNPEVKLGVGIEDDVKRRDLTYNALFYDLEKREIIDLVGGVSDMQNKITRMVGNPLERIDEDSLRILRAFRFASRYGTPLSDDLVEAIKKRKQLQNIDPESGEMKRISQERIWEEIKKSYKQAKSFKKYLEFFNEFDMWEEVFPRNSIKRSSDSMFIQAIKSCFFLLSSAADIFLGLRQFLWLINGRQEMIIENGNLTLTKKGTFFTKPKIYPKSFRNNLFKRLFFNFFACGSKINQKIVECDELTSYLANIFKFEDTQKLETKLVQSYRIEQEIASKVVFLIDLLKLKEDRAFELYKKKVRCAVTNSQIIDWLDTCNIHEQIFIFFIDYKPTVSAEDLMAKGFKGRELGEEIKRLEVENFRNLLKK